MKSLPAHYLGPRLSPRGSHTENQPSVLSRLFLLVLSTLAAMNSIAESGSHGATAALEPQVFASEIAAVVHATNTYNPISIAQDREYIGAIYRLDQGRGYLYSVAAGRKGADKISARLPKYQKARLVGFWHTHGADHWTHRYFSAVDTQLVKDSGLPFYMACADGHLRVFRPGDRVLSFLQAYREGLGKRSGFARGRRIPNVTIDVA